MSVTAPVVVPCITIGTKGTGSFAGSAVMVPEMVAVCAEANEQSKRNNRVSREWRMENEKVRMPPKTTLISFCLTNSVLASAMSHKMPTPRMGRALDKLSRTFIRLSLEFLVKPIKSLHSQTL